jgi:hypothetical protein
MWKTLVDRFDRIFDQTAPFSPPPSKPAFFTKLFQRSPELGDSFSLLYRIKRLIDRIKTGIKQVQVDQEDLMVKLRQSVPTIDSTVHIKDAPIAKYQPSADPAPRFLTIPLETFKPGDLGMSIIDLTDAIENVINDPAKRLVVTTHLMAADRIHTSVCASYPLLSVDRNLNLGESNAPIAILATLEEINKDELSEEVQQSMEVLKKSVTFYNAELQP